MEKAFILASQSPRRSRLLSEAGYRFDIVPSDIDEATCRRCGPEAAPYAESLARAKAGAVAARFPNRLVLGADTLIDCDGRIIGKAAHAAEAEEITRLLFSRPHRVITGIALIRIAPQLKVVTHDVTVVYPRPMSQAQIDAHIGGGTWEGKAGAYAIQENGDEFVERLDGSLTNVIGLPMELVTRLLSEQGIVKIEHRT